MQSEKNKKTTRAETIQNWVAFGLMAISIVLAVQASPWAPYILGAGVVSGLFFVIKRRLPKGPRVMTILALVSLLYLPLSYWLLLTFPDIYGAELGALVTWGASFVMAGLAAVALTSIELFRTSKG